MKNLKKFTSNNTISKIFINTFHIDETISYFINSLGFSKISKRVLTNGKLQFELKTVDGAASFIITEILDNDNVPTIQFGLNYLLDSNIQDVIQYLKNKGRIVKKLSSSDGYLGINCYVVTIDSSIPDFIIPDFDRDLEDYFEALSSSNQKSYAEYLEFEEFMSSQVEPSLVAELLDLKIYVRNLNKVIESLELLGFDFVAKKYNSLNFAKSTNCLFELLEDKTIDDIFSSEKAVFVIDAGVHFEFDGKVYTSNEIPIPSFNYLKEKNFNFINNVFNSKGETISNVAFVKDVNNIILEIRSWIKQEEAQTI